MTTYATIDAGELTDAELGSRIRLELAVTRALDIFGDQVRKSFEVSPEWMTHLRCAVLEHVMTGRDLEECLMD